MSTTSQRPTWTAEGQFIAGSYRAGSGDSHAVVDPATGETAATLALATAADVDTAVAAAGSAFGGWSTATPGARSALLTRLAAVLEERADLFARVESLQTGKPIKLAREFDVPGTIDNTAFFAGAARALAETPEHEHHTLIDNLYEPGQIISVKFVPQAWINDYAVDVDTEGPDTWEPTDLVAALSGYRDLDDVFTYEPWFKDDPACPEWVKNHAGPWRMIVDKAEQVD